MWAVSDPTSPHGWSAVPRVTRVSSITHQKGAKKKGKEIMLNVNWDHPTMVVDTLAACLTIENMAFPPPHDTPGKLWYERGPLGEFY
jgi:hypothetical protein